MGTKAKHIPDVLAVRYDRLQELKQAEAIYKQLNQKSNQTEFERAFLLDKIQKLKEDLEATEEETCIIIDSFYWYPRPWLISRLRFIHGHTWDEIASIIDAKTNAVKSAFYNNYGKAEL